VRHTGRSIYERCKKHFRDFKTGSSKSKFVGYLLDNHPVSTVENVGVLNIIKKGEHSSSLEKIPYLYRK
jgi:hypothetical protein